MGIHDDLIEQFAVQEVFCDGFANYVVSNNIMSCTGFRLHPPLHSEGPPLKVVVAKLIWPCAALDEAIFQARTALAKPFIFHSMCGPGRH